MSLQNIFESVQEHNDVVINGTPKGEKIDFSKCKKNWGTDVIPLVYWVSLEKKYKTRSGQDVLLHDIVLCNSSDKEVTYPVKGSITIKQDGKRDKTSLAVWSLDGRSNVCSPTPLGSDLIELK